MKNKLNHIELFAGCGGLSLGMESAGFDLFFANELSPMAAETFAYNILGEDLSEAGQNQNTLWLRSAHERGNTKKRLRENPLDSNQNMISDLADTKSIEGKLLVGDVNELLIQLSSRQDLLKEIQNADVDILSGGPPCQSFSLAGKRVRTDHKNTLPLSFARLTGIIKPKAILLENVKGITSPFTEGDTKYFAWLEVAKAFALEGYVPVCMMINSKYFGVAQNRPRYIMFAYRKDIFDRISTKHKNVKSNSLSFYNKVAENQENLNDVRVDDLRLYDIEVDPEIFNGDIFPKATKLSSEVITAEMAIDDLRSTEDVHFINDSENEYSRLLTKTFPNKLNSDESIIQNHNPRNHRYDVKARFRLYQVISQLKNGNKKAATDLLKGKNVSKHESDSLCTEVKKHQLYFKQGENEFYGRPDSNNDCVKYIKGLPSKKHSQRALKKNEPAPAQLTIPDDLCHYDMQTLRTMTVREMARFQSFPDWFVFKSKITTGGKMRKFEVPQYTQVGNAVPPLLGLSLGKALKRTIKTLQNG